MKKLVPIAIAALASCAVSIGAAQQQQIRPRSFVGDVDRLAGRNEDFRRVLHTGEHTQLVLMSIPVGESIGRETHASTDQCLFITDGTGRAVLEGRTSQVDDDSVVCVPAGVEHDLVNTGNEPLKLFTVYGPPQHPRDTVHHTRADAERAERHARR